jgi:hypothetical protein
MKTVYKTVKEIVSKNRFVFIQNQKTKKNRIKGEVHSDETNSLFSQMYSIENEILFI